MAVRAFIRSLLLSVFLFTPGYAAPASEPMQLLLLTVEINHHQQPGIAYAYLDNRHQIWLLQQDLCNMGLIVPPTHESLNYHGKTYFKLTSYPGLHYTLDEHALQLNIDAPSNLFPVTIIQDSQSPLINRLIRPNIPGGYLNYTLAAQNNNFEMDQNNMATLAQLGVFNYYGVGVNSVLLQDDNNVTNAIRMDTTWTQDQPEHIASWRLGDSITSAASWSGAVHFGGIQYATNFNTQPNLVTFPLPGIRSTAVLPSTVSLFVNNVMNQQTEVNSGPFIINNIPVVTGAGTIAVATRDILGNQQLVELPYYAAPQLLKPGLVDFSYEAGFIRENYGINSNDYGPAAAVASYSEGITNQLTLSSHGELLADQQTLGASANYLWRQLGVFSLSLAGSEAASQGGGGLVGLGFTRVAMPLSLNLQTTLSTSHFTQIGLLPGQLSPMMTTQAFLGYCLPGLGTFGLSYTVIQNRTEFTEPDDDWYVPATSNLVTATYSRNLWRNTTMIIGGIEDLKSHLNDQVFIGITIGVDAVHTATFNGVSQTNNNQVSTQYTKALPFGTGYGYQLQASQQDTSQFIGNFTAQNSMGTYNAGVANFANQNYYQIGASGSIVHFAGDTELARNFNNGGGSFGLVRIPNFNNVRVYYQNQLIGRTNRKGELFVPNLLPYQVNEIRIEPKDLPLDTHIGAVEESVIPYFKSGTLIEFPINKTHSVIFHLVLSSGVYVPEGAQVKFEMSQAQYPIGMDGEVYFDQVVNNIVKGTALWDNHSCDFRASMPDSNLMMPDLGKIICTQRS